MNDDASDIKIISFDSPLPVVIFEYKFFAFTGHFLSIKRKRCEEEVLRRGGILKENFNRLLNYLVIGEGLYEFMDRPTKFLNNKMEAALSLRAAGIPVAIISEHHFKNSIETEAKSLSDDIVRVNSFSVAEKKYEVSLQGLTCTCPNFIEDRAKYPINDPIRLCKHLVKALVDTRYVPPGLASHVEKIAVAAAYKGGIPGFQSFSGFNLAD